jgi:hypothetical protein
LISKNDLSTLIGSSYEELMLASFPKWDGSGNIEHDFEQYQNNVMLWAKNHPEIYRTYTASTGLMKVRLNEFEAMPQQKKNQVFNNPGGYLIIH